MTFGNVVGKISIFDINKRKTITDNDYSLQAIYSLDFHENMLLAGDSFGNFAISDI